MQLDCIAKGYVGHAREGSPATAFNYRVWMLLTDADQLDEIAARSALLSVDRFNLLSIHTSDWLLAHGPGSIRSRTERAIAAAGYPRPRGRIAMLHQPASLGARFNPVRFIFCFDSTGEGIEYVLGEINNTPWDERHTYVLRAAVPDRRVEFSFPKVFHVSPFNSMSQQYHWQFELRDDRLRVGMAVEEGDITVMRASLNLRLIPITASVIRRGALHYAAQPMVTLMRIYWHAARLWLRRTPIYSHPKWRTAP